MTFRRIFLIDFLRNFSYFIERKTLAGGSTPPDPPNFTWEPLPSENGYAIVKVYWHPNVGGNSGSHFFAKYRIKGQTTWLKTEEVLDSDHVIVRGLDPEQTYEFYVVSVDGGFIAESSVQEVPTDGIGNFEIDSR